MRILIITQKVDKNDPILGFFCRWVQEFAKHCEQVTVIALGVGEYDLQKNVRVFSLGKELRERSDLKNLVPRSVLEEQLQKVRYVLNFYRLIWRERKNYDAVFVHMNPIYVVLGGMLWRVLGKKIGLWYAHRSVDLKLRIAEKLAHIIFTTATESFRLKSKKTQAVGHGIDVDRFICEKRKDVGAEPITILHVGRITPIKNLDTLIEAAGMLRKEWKKQFRIILVGEPVMAGDVQYKKDLVSLAKERGVSDIIEWEGGVPNTQITEYYCKSDISVNLTPTGGVDKVVLESIAAGTPVFVSNKAFRSYFEKYARDFIFAERNARDLTDKINRFMSGDTQEKARQFLRQQTERKANMETLVVSIVNMLKYRK